MTEPTEPLVCPYCGLEEVTDNSRLDGCGCDGCDPPVDDVPTGKAPTLHEQLAASREREARLQDECTELHTKLLIQQETADLLDSGNRTLSTQLAEASTDSVSLRNQLAGMKLAITASQAREARLTGALEFLRDSPGGGALVVHRVACDALDSIKDQPK